ncbi:uncharacterized protein LOC132194218 [Neocloeon triangulifer]|uniref:uncharacterized protein LOC132194218 n=1 Tax=Neocloeon triangulifer TaxID=2078957 RepID=UPI00286EDDA5|nr:uncharacterized protein LOC132194218 [Neocloeon triangulifer]
METPDSTKSRRSFSSFKSASFIDWSKDSDKEDPAFRTPLKDLEKEVLAFRTPLKDFDKEDPALRTPRKSSRKEKVMVRNRKADSAKLSLSSKEPKEEEKTAIYKLFLKILFLFLAIVTSVICALLVSITLIEDRKISSPKIGSYKSALEKQVFGQDKVIEDVLKKFTAMYRTALEGDLNVILLSGGPGVGKDLVAQIMTAEFHAQAGPTCISSSFLLFGHNWPICKRTDLNVIQLETIINESDILKATELIKQISRQGIKGIIFLPVLAAKALNEGVENAVGLENLKTVEDYQEIVLERSLKVQKLLSVNGIKCDMVVFRPLTRDIVEKCLGPKGISAINYVMQGREFALQGCKQLEEFKL